MLSDDELARPAFESISAGESASAAWEAAMADEISGYRAGEDAYFSARAADLEDIRDRVLGHLAPAADGAPHSRRLCGCRGRPASLALSRHRLGAGRRHCVDGGQPDQPRRHARARPPRANGRGPRRRRRLDGRPRGAGRRRQRRSGAGSDGRHPHRLRREGWPRRGRSRRNRGFPSAAGDHEGRNRDLRKPQRRQRRRARRDRSRDLRRDWPRAHGTDVLRTGRAAGRGRAIRGLSPHPRLGPRAVPSPYGPWTPAATNPSKA